MQIRTGGHTFEAETGLHPEHDEAYVEISCGGSYGRTPGDSEPSVIVDWVAINGEELLDVTDLRTRYPKGAEIEDAVYQAVFDYAEVG